MRKAIGLMMCLLLVAGCLSVSNTDEGEVEEEVQIVETKKIEYLTDEDFSKLYTCRADVRKTDDSIVELSQEDAYLLMQVARKEGGTSLNGQMWVARTILNRLDDNWADSLWGVLTMDNQFEVVTNGSYVNADLNPESHLALAMVEGGWNETDGALYWESNTNSDESWHKKNLTFIKEVDGNLYYK